MATNAIGLNLLLQASNTQLKDLLEGLKPGDVLRARIVDLLPEGKAVINLQGQNLLAQLPAPQQGQVFQKGDLLSLEVTQAQVQTKPQNPSGSGSTSPAPTGASNAPTTPVTTLRILPSTSMDRAQSSTGTRPEAQSAPIDSAGVPKGPALPPIAVLEQALNGARVPVTQATLAVVRTLAAAGLPLDAQTIQSVVQQAESLLGAEQAAPKIQPNSAALPEPVRVQMQEALPALRLAVQTTPNASTRVGFQQTLTVIEEALSSAPSAPLPPSPTSSTTGPANAAPLPKGGETTPANPALMVAKALQAVIAQPTPENIQALRESLSQAMTAPTSSPVIQTQVPVAASVPVNGQPKEAKSSVERSTAPSTSETPDPIALPVRRETTVLLIRTLPPVESAQNLEPRQVIQAAVDLKAALQDPQSPASQDLLKSVQSQFPQSEPTLVLEQAKQALDQVIVHFETLPPSRTLAGPQALSAELEAATLPAPRQALNQFPREIVFEAVAWLKARDLPPQRPLVEAAAQFLSQGHETLDIADKVSQARHQLPEGFLEERPALKSAFDGLERAIQQSTLKLDRGDLAEQLRQWPRSSGLDLEKTLLNALPRATDGADLGDTAQRVVSRGNDSSAPSLKEALAQVQHELKAAMRDGAGSTATVSPVLERAAGHANEALQGLSALPLQSQPGPATQSVTLPLALPLNGPLSHGQLTVSWRKGQDRALDDKEPVNVAVALKTESLGEVRVLMQVWKGAASVVVRTEDKGTSDYLASGAKELQDGFAERTPFRLQQLSFDVSTPDSSPLNPELALPTRAGMDLSA